jgi:hypothetical protein
MTGDQQFNLILALSTCGITTAGLVIVAWIGARNGDKSDKVIKATAELTDKTDVVHEQINGHMKEISEQVKQIAHTAGVQEGIAQAKAESGDAEALVVGKAIMAADKPTPEDEGPAKTE